MEYKYIQFSNPFCLFGNEMISCIVGACQLVVVGYIYYDGAIRLNGV